MSLLQYCFITVNFTLCSFHSLFRAKRVISESWPSRKRVSNIYLVVVLSFRRFGVCKISSNSFSSSSLMLTSSTTYWSPLLCKKLMKCSEVYKMKAHVYREWKQIISNNALLTKPFISCLDAVSPEHVGNRSFSWAVIDLCFLFVPRRWMTLSRFISISGPTNKKHMCR